MKLLARGVSLVVGGSLWFVGHLLGKALQESPGAPRDDLLAGVEALQIVGALLIFLIWFHWRRTALAAPDWSKYRPMVATSLVVLGVLVIGIPYFMLHVVVFSESGPGSELIKDMLLSRGLDVAGLVVALGATTIAAGVGLYQDKRWARILAKLITLLYAGGGPVGLVVATYTWWALNPNRSPLLEGQDANQTTGIPPRPEAESRKDFRHYPIPEAEDKGHVPILGLALALVALVVVALAAFVLAPGARDSDESYQTTEFDSSPALPAEISRSIIPPTDQFAPADHGRPPSSSADISSSIAMLPGAAPAVPLSFDGSPGATVSETPETENAPAIDDPWNDPLPASRLSSPPLDVNPLKISDIRRPLAYFSPETVEIAVSNAGTETVRELTIGFFRKNRGSCSGDLERYDGFKKFHVYLPPGDSVTVEEKFSAQAKSFCIISAR